jgi:hypothetical protein
MTAAKPLKSPHRDLSTSLEMTAAVTKSLLPRDFQ